MANKHKSHILLRAKAAGRGSVGGFTLIELLVVVAIIALLMSILFLTLKVVRRQVRAVICQSNLHQWGIYFNEYISDHNGYFHTPVYFPWDLPKTPPTA